MTFLGTFKVLRNNIRACDYEYVLHQIVKAKLNNKSLLISPIASHTLVRAFYDPALEKTLNTFNHLVPDSHWVLWALRYLYGIRLRQRVYGPQLMMRICHQAVSTGQIIFLYGNTLPVLKKLKLELHHLCLGLKIGHIEPSPYRPLTPSEWTKLIRKMIAAKTSVVFIGLGSPYQEIFTVELMRRLSQKNKKMIIVPVGAAFDFLAKEKPTAPRFLQESGFEWFFRLITEPRRLYKRYMVYGPLFIFLILRQKRLSSNH